MGLEPTTLYTLDRVFYQLSYQGSSTGWAQILNLIVHLMNRLTILSTQYMKENAGVVHLMNRLTILSTQYMKENAGVVHLMNRLTILSTQYMKENAGVHVRAYTQHPNTTVAT